jgi:hypothetical protein
LFETTSKLSRTSSNTEFLPPACQDGEYSIHVEQQVFETIDEAKLRFTLVLILIAILANIWLLFVKTFDLRQHCDTRPISVSQILLIFPVDRYYQAWHICNRSEETMYPVINTTLPYKLPFSSGRIASSKSIFWSLSLFCASW